MPVANADDIVVDSIDTVAGGMPIGVVTKQAVVHGFDLVFVVELRTGADWAASFDGWSLVCMVPLVLEIHVRCVPQLRRQNDRSLSYRYHDPNHAALSWFAKLHLALAVVRRALE